MVALSEKEGRSRQTSRSETRKADEASELGAVLTAGKSGEHGRPKQSQNQRNNSS
jgi:hypothetical protein